MIEIAESYLSKLEDRNYDLACDKRDLKIEVRCLKDIIWLMAKDFPKHSKKLQEILETISEEDKNSIVESFIKFYKAKLRGKKMKPVMKLKTKVTLYLDYYDDTWDVYKPDYDDYAMLRKGSVLRIYPYEEWNGEADPNFKYAALDTKDRPVMFFGDDEDIDEEWFEVRK